MEVIELKTLVDITNTNVRRASQGTEQELEQYKNWITLNQCIELRSVMTFDGNPTVETVDLKGLGFGTEYKGQHKVWTWRFYPDRANIFATENSPLALLIEDLDQVPVIRNLTETINILRPVFELTDKKLINTKLKIISGT